MSNRVVVIISGGVADVVAKPNEVEVIIRDYDVEPSEAVDRDRDGYPCIEQVWGYGETIQP